MRRSFRALAALSVVTFLTRPQIAMAIGASPDPSKPSQASSYLRIGGGPGSGFEIVEPVDLDPAAGPWEKTLMNNGQGGVARGVDLSISEVLTNIGTESWTGWHEHIVSRTTINSPNDSPGFLFREGSLTLSANYGLGFVPLTQGTHYTLATTPYSGPPDPLGNGTNWEAIDIFFLPAAQIGPGNILRIDKEIFEVFLDANIWRPDEAAIIAEFPAVPEPAGLSVCALALAAVARRRRGAEARASSPGMP